MEFQSAPPVKGATNSQGYRHLIFMVSIRAPREGGDGLECALVRVEFVSIRAPREGGDFAWDAAEPFKNSFNPRPP